MLQEQTEIDKIEIVKDTIQVREVINILKDGQIIASSYKRYMIKKEDNITNYDIKIQNIAKAIWPEMFLTVEENSAMVDL